MQKSKTSSSYLTEDASDDSDDDAHKRNSKAQVKKVGRFEVIGGPKHFKGKLRFFINQPNVGNVATSVIFPQSSIDAGNSLREARIGSLKENSVCKYTFAT